MKLQISHELQHTLCPGTKNAFDVYYAALFIHKKLERAV